MQKIQKINDAWTVIRVLGGDTKRDTPETCTKSMQDDVILFLFFCNILLKKRLKKIYLLMISLMGKS